MFMCFSHMSLHPLRVSVGIVRGWRRVREASWASVLPQPCFRTLLCRARPWTCPLSCWIHLIGWAFLYGWSKAHAVAGILGGVSVVVIGKLGCAVQQATVSGVISRRLKSWIGRCLLALCHPGEGVELGIGGMRHPGRGTGVVASSPWTWHCAGGHCTTGRCWRPAGCGTSRSAVWVRGPKLSLVVHGVRLGARLVVGGGSDVVVAVGWILRSQTRLLSFQAYFLHTYGLRHIKTVLWLVWLHQINDSSLTAVCVSVQGHSMNMT